jgi:flavin reductase (DIM6/NTAB) family NADH-FMN oxidoreductase RutF
MPLSRIPIDQFTVRAHQLWHRQWLLLTAGDLAAERFNMMTVAWGSLGTMWNRPFAQVVVRPTRHTYAFTEEFDSFTLTAFPERFRPILKELGTRSGRDMDKMTGSGLTPIAGEEVAAPAFAEAELIVECRTIYHDDLDPTRFLDPAIEDQYPERDYHRVYFGEILAVRGTDRFRTDPA